MDYLIIIPQCKYKQYILHYLDQRRKEMFLINHYMFVFKAYWEIAGLKNNWTCVYRNKICQSIYFSWFSID